MLKEYHILASESGRYQTTYKAIIIAESREEAVETFWENPDAHEYSAETEFRAEDWDEEFL